MYTDGTHASDQRTSSLCCSGVILRTFTPICSLVTSLLFVALVAACARVAQHRSAVIASSKQRAMVPAGRSGLQVGNFKDA